MAATVAHQLNQLVHLLLSLLHQLRSQKVQDGVKIGIKMNCGMNSIGVWIRSQASLVLVPAAGAVHPKACSWRVGSQT